jgi:hypothetical protein
VIDFVDEDNVPNGGIRLVFKPDYLEDRKRRESDKE